jgi:hypothetical protein
VSLLAFLWCGGKMRHDTNQFVVYWLAVGGTRPNSGLPFCVLTVQICPIAWCFVANMALHGWPFVMPPNIGEKSGNVEVTGTGCASAAFAIAKARHSL